MQNNVLNSIIRHTGTLLCTKWQRDGCLSEHWGFPCQYHSTNATNWYFIILPSTLLSLRKWQPLSFVTTEGQQNKTSHYCGRSKDYDNGSAYEQTPEYRTVCFCHLCSTEQHTCCTLHVTRLSAIRQTLMYVSRNVYTCDATTYFELWIDYLSHGPQTFLALYSFSMIIPRGGGRFSKNLKTTSTFWPHKGEIRQIYIENP